MTHSPRAKRSAPETTGRWLRITGIILAFLGLLVAAYMSWSELSGIPTSCPGGTEGAIGQPGALAIDCGFVQNSVYARIIGIPVALLGFAGYLAILLLWIFQDRAVFLREYSHALIFGLALFGFLFSLYLTYTELFLIYTICTWCVTSAILMTLVFIIATIRLVQFMRNPAI
ncbi:MAG: vitamin K epoxide reductase family protein [Anaerolineae bacterium]|nr:vitamin K epoxide reductase family protein [Anaerolineae bacterium]